MKSSEAVFWHRACSHQGTRMVLAAALWMGLSVQGQASDCVPVPPNLVSWWRAELNTVDEMGNNPGTLQGTAGYAQGEVGLGFQFYGGSSAVVVGNPYNLQSQDFSIEGWVQRNSTTVTTDAGFGIGFLFSYGANGYGFGINNNGACVLTRVGVDSVSSPAVITDTRFHHVAVTKSGTTVTFYVDGLPVTSVSYGVLFSFATQAEIGNSVIGGGFMGIIDELAVYRGALTLGNIQAIYAAGAYGKCAAPAAPELVSQPVSQNVWEGDTVTFNVSATGSPLLKMQWLYNGDNLNGATNFSLILTDVGLAQAGTYSVVVSNDLGAVISTGAVLTVQHTTCFPDPAGLISWWPAEGNGVDEVGMNHGTLLGGAGYVPGQRGLAFGLDGYGGSAIAISGPANLALQDFTIEGWIKRANPASVSRSGAYGFILSYGVHGYGFAIDPTGSLVLTQVGDNSVSVPTALTDTTNFHHVVVTKQGSTVVFYLDGKSYPAPPYAPSFTFTWDLAIGAIGHDLTSVFWGAIDELSVYGRALSGAEIQGIYNAHGAGKCAPPVPPYILLQPQGQALLSGDSFALEVLAGGAIPLLYQWTLYGTNLPGRTDASLSLTNAQVTDAGPYTVVVSNAFGSITSSVALVTISTRPQCASLPAGTISFWPADGDARDAVGSNGGTLANGAGFGMGLVDHAFLFGGGSDVEVPDAPSLDPPNAISIDAWVFLSDPNGTPLVLVGKDDGIGQRQYLLNVVAGAGGPVCRAHVGTPNGFLYTTGSKLLQAGIWNHVAMTYDGNMLTLFVNGEQDAQLAVNGHLAATAAPLRIGGGGSAGTLMDEIGLYGRALSPTEIRAIYTAGSGGKCPTTVGPFLLAQPSDQTVVVGSHAAVSVNAAGSVPFGFQWSFNGSRIAGATDNTLTLPAVGFDQAGSYSVQVTNLAGSVTSREARLSVVYPPATLLLGTTNVTSGQKFRLPVQLVANGNENALSFSMNFDPNRLRFVGAFPDGGVPDEVVAVNTSLTNVGSVGLALALPAGLTLAPGSQAVTWIQFATAVLTNSEATTISFGDLPFRGEIFDNQLTPLEVTFGNSTSVLLEGAPFEGDLSPRPDGDQSVDVADWLQAGRYAARLDYPISGAEFQRADCAPKETGGDGLITVADWVQTGRFAFGLDPWQVASGPTNEMPFVPAAPSPTRLIYVEAASLTPSQVSTIAVSLSSQGDENALGLSLQFEPGQVTLQSVKLGIDAGAAGASLIVNTNQTPTGLVGIALALAPGSRFPAGKRELVRFSFLAAPTVGVGLLQPLFSDIPVPREVADAEATVLPTGYATNASPLRQPGLRIALQDQVVLLAWPSWATNFVLQQASEGLFPPSQWKDVLGLPQVSAGENQMFLPRTNTASFYRLR